MRYQSGLTRRTFLVDLSKTSLGVAVFGLAVVACSDEGSTPSTLAPPTSTTSSSDPASTTTQPVPPSTTTSMPSEEPSAAEGVAWRRVEIGSVSAYIVTRAGEAAIVDTGVGGSAGEIEAGLGAIGIGWDAVGEVIVTHHHGDHQGSLGEVLASAPEASAYAGAADIPLLTSPRPVTAVKDGDRVFGLDIIETPGHTAGHISVLDAESGLFIAGDALRGDGGGVVGPSPRFSDDMDLANASVLKIAELSLETLLFGHGDPVEGGAGSLLADLAASLGG